MAKSKDPAFLFYPSDFILGTYTMTDEQVGKYIRLLCLQFSKGGKLTERELLSINRDNDPYVNEKFIYEDGYYYNAKLKTVVEEREQKAMVNRENGNKGGNPNFQKGKHNPYYNREDNQAVMLIDNRKDNQKINIALEDININKNKDLDVIKDDLKESIKMIIEYLNSRLNTHYKTSSSKTRDLIKARFNDGYTLDDFQKVIDTKVDEWQNDDKMSKFLRPETLFSNKFESYLNQPINEKKKLKKSIGDEMSDQYEKTGDFFG